MIERMKTVGGKTLSTQMAEAVALQRLVEC